MKKKNWEIVLEAMYENEEQGIEANADFLERDTDLDESEIREAMSYLERAGLLDPKSSKSVINSKGFEVIHGRKQREERIRHDEKMIEKRIDRDEEMNKRQDLTNQAIGFLTLGLVFVTSLDTLTRALVGGNEQNWALLTGIFAVAIAVIYGLAIYRTGILDFSDTPETVSNQSRTKRD